jgi:hypothetical protein
MNELFAIIEICSGVYIQLAEIPPLDFRFLLDCCIMVYDFAPPIGYVFSILVMLKVCFKWSKVRFVSVFCLVSVSFKMILFLYMRR